MKDKDTGVRQLKNGFWAYRFSIAVNGRKISGRGTTDTQGKVLKTKAEAIKARKLAIAKAQSMPPENRPIEKKTMKEVYKEYREKGCSDRAYTTTLKQDSLWKNHIEKAFGKRIVDDIRSIEVTDYLTKLYYDDGYSYRYVESFLKLFYLIFGQAYSRNYMSIDKYNKLCKNKDTKIHMPKLKIEDDLDIAAFSEKERDTIDNYFRGSNAETAYMLGRFCGLRINEAYGLKWEDVDLENGVIHIRQQMQYQKGLVILAPLKTRKAKRDVYLNQRMISYMNDLMLARKKAEETFPEQRKQQQKDIPDLDGSKFSSLGLVNCLPNGKLQTVNSMKFHSKQIKKLGIAFKFHYLRHTYGTLLAEMNTPLHILCRQMGHAGYQVTEKYYVATSKQGVDTLKANLEKL